jgi:hypothetical protein
MRIPLFITPQSLSPRTAIGTQTKRLVNECSQWRHLYWAGAELRSLDPRSARIDSLLFTRIGPLRDRPSSLSNALRKRGFSWWDGERPSKKLANLLREKYAASTSKVYVAPLHEKDAARMRAILEILQSPFVLHLWDLLDDKQIDQPATRWLIEQAEHVFCVSETLMRSIPKRPDCVSILRFGRSQSPVRAKLFTGAKLKIATLGNMGSYLDGTLLLDKAITSLRGSVEIELVYVGLEKHLNGWRHHLKNPVRATGFAYSDDRRDELLAECHVGFLPGPSNDPTTDSRSRYSIPSRVLDFFAVGLPVLATVNPYSATAEYLKGLGWNEDNFRPDVSVLSQRLAALASPSNWLREADRSKAAFEQVSIEDARIALWLNI